MDQTIDRLQIEIQQKAANKSNQIQKLSQSLAKLKSDVGSGISGLNKISVSLTSLSSSINKLKGNLSVINSLGNSFKKLNNLNVSGISTGVKQLSDASNTLNSIGNSLNSAMSFRKGINAITKSVEKLNNLNINGLSTGIKQLTGAANTLNGIGNSLSSIKDFGKGINSIKKYIEKIDNIDFSKAESQIKQLVNAIKPLTDEMLRSGAAVDKYASQMKEFISAANKANSINVKQSGTSKSKINKIFDLGKLYVAFNSVKSAASAIGGSISNINSYVEDMNLFTVAMGEAANEGENLANKMQDLLGIDAGQAMRNMGLFQQLTTSFGVASDQATVMSKNLTQLGFDIASFYNLKIDESFLKLQSGIAGEIEPLRRIGIDISEARLQLELYNMGIDASVENLSQADKSMLRYVAIMRQSTNAQTDMARTLNSPANALRVLDAQITLASRSIGSIFIPILNAVLPVVTAVVQVIAELAGSFALISGFEMPTVDYSQSPTIGGSSGVDFDNLSSGADDYAKSLKNVAKNQREVIGGFDELNILSENSTSDGTGGSAGGGGVGGAGAGSILGGIKLPEYDMFQGLVSSKVRQYADAIRDFINSFKNSAGVKLVTELLSKLWDNVIKPFGEWCIKNPDTIANIFVAIGIGIATYKVAKVIESVYTAIKKFQKGQSLARATRSLGKFGAIFTNPYILGISLAAAAIAGIGLAVYQTWQDLKKADLESRFGEITLSLEESREVAENLTKTDFVVKIKIASKATEELKELESSINDTIFNLNKYEWKIGVGMELTEEEKEDYRNNLENFISQTQQYVSDHTYAIKLTIDALFGEDSDIGNSIVETSEKISSLASEQLSSLGKQLQNKINESFEDGLLEIDEVKEIKEIREQMQNITAALSQGKIEASFGTLDMKYDGADLTPESYQQLLSDLDSVSKELKESAESEINETLGRLEGNLAFAKLNGDPDLIDEAQKAIDDFVKNNPLEAKFDEIDMQIADFKWDTLMEAFGTEKTQMESLFSSSVEEAMNSGLKDAFLSVENQSASSMSDLITNLIDQYGIAVSESGLSAETKSNLAEMLNDSFPKIEQLQKLAEDARNAGKLPADEIRSQLTDAATLQAISGDTEAITYLIGEKLSTDPSFLDMLVTVGDAAKQVPESMRDGILNNTKVVTDASNQTVTLINDTIGEKTYEVTPEVLENLKALGIKIPEGLKNGVNTNKSQAEKAAKDASKSTVSKTSETLKSEMDKKKPSINETFGTPKNSLSKNMNYTSWFHIVDKAGDAIWDALSSIKLPHFKVWFDPNGWGADIWKKVGLGGTPSFGIDWYATGGVFNSPNIIGVGEAGPEAVIPLSENAKWINAVSKQIESDMKDWQGNVNVSNESYGDVYVTVQTYVDSKKVSEEVKKISRREARRYSPSY